MPDATSNIIIDQTYNSGSVVESGTWTVTRKGDEAKMPNGTPKYQGVTLYGLSLDYYGALVTSDAGSAYRLGDDLPTIYFVGNTLTAREVTDETRTYILGNGAAITNYGGYRLQNFAFTDNLVTFTGTATVNGNIYGGAIVNLYDKTGSTSFLTQHFLEEVTFTGNTVSSTDSKVVAYGGAIANLGYTQYIKEASFTNNSADFGGAIYNDSPDALNLIGGFTFSGNSATEGGAIYNAASSTIRIQDAVTLLTSSDTIANYGAFVWNLDGIDVTATLNGYSNLVNYGTLEINVDPTMSNSYILATGVEDGDGTLASTKKSFVLTGHDDERLSIEIGASTATTYGIYDYSLNVVDTDSVAGNNNAQLVLTVVCNSTLHITADNSPYEVTQNTVWENNPDGAIEVNESGILKQDVSTQNVIFRNNTKDKDNGGAIYNAGTTTLTNVSFIGNTVLDGDENLASGKFYGGGAIANGNDAVLVVSNGTFSGNRANKATSKGHNTGGAVFNQGNATFENCLFTDQGVGGQKGSAVFNSTPSVERLENPQGYVTFIGCTFTQNNASSTEGIVNDNGGTTIFEDCSFIANTNNQAISTNGTIIFHGTNTFDGNRGALSEWGSGNATYRLKGQIKFDGVISLKTDADVFTNNWGYIFWDLTTSNHSATIDGFSRVKNGTNGTATAKTETRWAVQNGFYIQLSTDQANQAAKYVLATGCEDTLPENKQYYILTTGLKFKTDGKLDGTNLQDGAVCLQAGSTNTAVFKAYQGGLARVVHDTDTDQLELWTKKVSAFFVDNSWTAGSTQTVQYAGAPYEARVNTDLILFNGFESAKAQATHDDDVVAIMGGTFSADLVGEGKKLDFAATDTNKIGQVIAGKKDAVSTIAANTISVSQNLQATALIGGDKFGSTFSKSAELSRTNISDSIKLKSSSSVNTNFLVAGSFLYSAADANSNNNVYSFAGGSTLTVEAGADVIAKTVVGGSIVGGSTNLDVSGTSNLTDASTTNLVFNAGSYTKIFGGGYLQNSSVASLTKTGNVNITINGGNYKHVYGGIGASKLALLPNATMEGAVNITVNASSAIKIDSIFGGNSGKGSNTKSSNATITFTGLGSLLNVSGSVCGGHATDEKTAKSLGNSQLVFAGFNGNFGASEIADFNKVSVVNLSTTDSEHTTTEVGSLVTFTKELDLSDVKEWTFESGCKLTWEDGTNDFAGDTLNFNGFSSLEVNEFAEVFVGSENTLTGWDDTSTIVKFDGVSTSNFTLTTKNNSLVVTRIA